MDREKIREIAETENWRKKRRLAAVVLSASIAVFLAGVVLYSPSTPGPTDVVDGTDSGEQELTKYQQTYVDCPDQYLPLCTKMSKIPTEPVKYQKTEGDQLYLELPRSDRTLIAHINNGGEDGYLVSING